MKAQLVMSLGFAGSCVTFSERLQVILLLRPAVIVTLLRDRYAVSIVFVLTLISRLSFNGHAYKTDNCKMDT